MNPKQIFKQTFEEAKKLLNSKKVLSVIGEIAIVGIITAFFFSQSGTLLKADAQDIHLFSIPPGVDCEYSPASPKVGQTVTFTAKPFAFSGAVSYVWTGTDNPYNASPTATAKFNNTGDYVVKVEAQHIVLYEAWEVAKADCNVTVVADTAVQKVAAPEVACTASPASPKIGETVTFTATANGFNDDNKNVTFTWSGGVQGNGNPLVKIFNSAGTYAATVTGTETFWSFLGAMNMITNTAKANCFITVTAPTSTSTTTSTTNLIPTPTSTSTTTPPPTPSSTAVPTPATTPLASKPTQEQVIESAKAAQSAAPAPEVLNCKIDSHSLMQEYSIPLRADCTLTANATVNAQIIKGTFDPEQATDQEVTIVKNIIFKSSQSAKPFLVLWDGIDLFGNKVEPGEYTFVSFAKVSQWAKPDYFTQPFTVVGPTPVTPATETGTTSELTPTTSGTSTSTIDTATHSAAPESSKCPGLNYPNDISGHWAEALIKKGYDICLFKGYAEGTFRPNQNITRAEAVKISLSAAGVKPKVGCYDADCGSSFTDLDMWQGAWIRPAWDLKIVNGITPTSFEPNRNITRAEAAVLVAKSFKILPHQNCYTPNCGAGYPNNFFTDITEFWQGAYVRALWDKGLISASTSNRFEPNRPITRAELAKIILTGK